MPIKYATIKLPQKQKIGEEKMKRLISVLLLLALALTLLACNGLNAPSNTETTTPQATTPEATTPETPTPETTTPEATTPSEPETLIDPDVVGFRLLSTTYDSYTFRAIIDSENDNAYISLESFFNEILSTSLFGNTTYEETLADTDWFVDDKPAVADTKIFNNGIVVLKAKDAVPPDDKTIKIVFYHTMGMALQSVLEKYIAEFNMLYPNIVIEHKQIGGYDDVRDQIMTDITVGEQPNIAYCYPDHIALYNVADAVQTLDDFINSMQTVIREDGTTEKVGLTQQQLDDFIDGFYGEGRIYGDGKMYTLPMSKSTEVLYYNKTFFEEHNLTVPTTWEEMEALCEQIKQIDPNCIPLGYDSEANWFITMCQQYGSPYTSAIGANRFLFDNETNRAFVAKLREWYQKGYVTTQEITGNYTSYLFTAEQFNCYMSIASSADANHQMPKNDNGTFRFEVGVAPIPQADRTNPKVISQGPSLCIFKNSNPDKVLASWLFVKFLTTNADFQAEFALTSGYLPVLESVLRHPIYTSELEAADGYTNLPSLVAKVASAQAYAFFNTPAFVGSAAAREVVGDLLSFCLTDPSCATAAGIRAAFEEAVRECLHKISS